jgi:hypothetical protein
MAKIMAIITAKFVLFGIAGCGAHQSQSTQNIAAQPADPQPNPCPQNELWVNEDGTISLGCGTDPDEGKLPSPPPQVLDIQAGASLSRDRLTLVACVETLFVGPLSAQVCGSGRGLFLDKHDPAPELTQYRVRLRWARASWGRLWLAPIVQAGMSELRAGTMDAEYLPGRGSSRQLALGPAIGTALQLLWPLGKGLELVGDIHLEAAYIPRAGDLELPQAELQPTLGAALGIGF